MQSLAHLFAQVLLDDIRDRSTKKGELFEEDKALHAKLEKHKSTTEGALQRFLTASAAAEASRKQFHFAQQDASIPPKKLKYGGCFVVLVVFDFDPTKQGFGNSGGQAVE